MQQQQRNNGKQVSILDKSLSRGKSEASILIYLFETIIYLQINLSTFALLFVEMIRYSQNRVNTVAELQAK